MVEREQVEGQSEGRACRGEMRWDPSPRKRLVWRLGGWDALAGLYLCLPGGEGEIQGLRLQS